MDSKINEIINENEGQYDYPAEQLALPSYEMDIPTVAAAVIVSIPPKLRLAYNAHIDWNTLEKDILPLSRAHDAHTNGEAVEIDESHQNIVCHNAVRKSNLASRGMLPITLEESHILEVALALDTFDISKLTSLDYPPTAIELASIVSANATIVKLVCGHAADLWSDFTSAGLWVAHRFHRIISDAESQLQSSLPFIRTVFQYMFPMLPTQNYPLPAVMAAFVVNDLAFLQTNGFSKNLASGLVMWIPPQRGRGGGGVFESRERQDWWPMLGVKMREFGVDKKRRRYLGLADKGEGMELDRRKIEKELGCKVFLQEGSGIVIVDDEPEAVAAETEVEIQSVQECFNSNDQFENESTLFLPDNGIPLGENVCQMSTDMRLIGNDQSPPDDDVLDFNIFGIDEDSVHHQTNSAIFFDPQDYHIPSRVIEQPLLLPPLQEYGTPVQDLESNNDLWLKDMLLQEQEQHPGIQTTRATTQPFFANTRAVGTPSAERETEHYFFPVSLHPATIIAEQAPIVVTNTEDEQKARHVYCNGNGDEEYDVLSGFFEHDPDEPSGFFREFSEEKQPVASSLEKSPPGLAPHLDYRNLPPRQTLEPIPIAKLTKVVIVKEKKPLEEMQDPFKKTTNYRPPYIEDASSSSPKPQCRVQDQARPVPQRHEPTIATPPPLLPLSKNPQSLVPEARSTSTPTSTPTPVPVVVQHHSPIIPPYQPLLLAQPSQLVSTNIPTFTPRPKRPKPDENDPYALGLAIPPKRVPAAARIAQREAGGIRVKPWEKTKPAPTDGEVSGHGQVQPSYHQNQTGATDAREYLLLTSRTRHNDEFSNILAGAVKKTSGVHERMSSTATATEIALSRLRIPTAPPPQQITEYIPAPTLRTVPRPPSPQLPQAEPSNISAATETDTNGGVVSGKPNVPTPPPPAVETANSKSVVKIRSMNEPARERVALLAVEKAREERTPTPEEDNRPKAEKKLKPKPRPKTAKTLYKSAEYISDSDDFDESDDIMNPEAKHVTTNTAVHKMEATQKTTSGPTRPASTRVAAGAGLVASIGGGTNPQVPSSPFSNETQQPPRLDNSTKDPAPKPAIAAMKPPKRAKSASSTRPTANPVLPVSLYNIEENPQKPALRQKHAFNPYEFYQSIQNRATTTNVVEDDAGGDMKDVDSSFERALHRIHKLHIPDLEAGAEVGDRADKGKINKNPKGFLKEVSNNKGEENGEADRSARVLAKTKDCIWIIEDVEVLEDDGTLDEFNTSILGTRPRLPDDNFTPELQIEPEDVAVLHPERLGPGGALQLEEEEDVAKKPRASRKLRPRPSPAPKVATTRGSAERSPPPSSSKSVTTKKKPKLSHTVTAVKEEIILDTITVAQPPMPTAIQQRKSVKRRYSGGSREKYDKQMESSSSCSGNDSSVRDSKKKKKEEEGGGGITTKESEEILDERKRKGIKLTPKLRLGKVGGVGGGRKRNEPEHESEMELEMEKDHKNHEPIYNPPTRSPRDSTPPIPSIPHPPQPTTAPAAPQPFFIPPNGRDKNGRIIPPDLWAAINAANGRMSVPEMIEIENRIESQPQGRDQDDRGRGRDDEMGGNGRDRAGGARMVLWDSYRPEYRDRRGRDRDGRGRDRDRDRVDARGRGGRGGGGGNGRRY